LCETFSGLRKTRGRGDREKRRRGEEEKRRRGEEGKRGKGEVRASPPLLFSHTGCCQVAGESL
jgi:hypothetical protein